jgi:hypothetical protein
MRTHNDPLGLAPRFWISGILTIFVIAAIALFFLPGVMVHDQLAPKARLDAENDLRTAGLQMLGAIALGIGAVFTGITLIYNREHQITERFSRAVEQLANDYYDVRLGAIYALERIARDSRRDEEPIRNILRSYVDVREAEGAGRPDVLAARSVLERLWG